MEQLWKVRAEIEIEPADSELGPGYTKGFMNVIVCAESARTAEAILGDYLRTFNWNLIGVEECCPIGVDFVPGSELSEMVDRAMGNPNAIILGTFHAYLVQ